MVPQALLPLLPTKTPKEAEGRLRSSDLDKNKQLRPETSQQIMRCLQSPMRFSSSRNDKVPAGYVGTSLPLATCYRAAICGIPAIIRLVI